jgi:hypothetical protein
LSWRSFIFNFSPGFNLAILQSIIRWVSFRLAFHQSSNKETFHADPGRF